MSPPIRDGSGSSIENIRLGDGSEISEVRTGAGDVLFSGIPASAVLNAVAGSYDASKSKWVANIGPDIPDAAGNPSTTSNALNGFDAVSYDGESDISQLTQSLSSTDPKAVVFTAAIFSLDDNGVPVDAKTDLKFGLNDDTDDDWALFRGGTTHEINQAIHNTSFHTYSLNGQNSDEIGLDIDGIQQGSATASDGTLDGLTIGGAGALRLEKEMDIAEITVLDGYSSGEKDSEISRQMNKYGL